MNHSCKSITPGCYRCELNIDEVADDGDTNSNQRHENRGAGECASCKGLIDQLKAKIMRLEARVGWLDFIDTHEGRVLYANEALLVEKEELVAKIKSLHKSALELINQFDK